MNCKICDHGTKAIFKAKILNKYHITYFHCDHCGFVQTEAPFWLEEAYLESINLSDTGILQRNLLFAEQTTPVLFFLFDRSGKFLDYAGGYGIFTRLMRDIGFDFYWHDPFTKNLFARGFEYNDNISNIELITSFECFEHLVKPLTELNRMLQISHHILFSTQLLPAPIPAPGNWWYYGLEHGQHISFYTVKTLTYLARINGLNFYTNGSYLHLMTNKKIKNSQFTRLLKASKKYSRKIKQVLISRTVADMNTIKTSTGIVDEDIV